MVYCERTLRACADAYRRSAPQALLELFGAAGVGADVSTLGELVFALRARIPGARLIVHGNNKSDEELHAAAEAGALYVVRDALEKIPRAAAAEVGRVRVRVTPGIEADTHVAITTGHHGSKFGLPPDQALEAIAHARAAAYVIDLGGASASSTSPTKHRRRSRTSPPRSPGGSSTSGTSTISLRPISSSNPAARSSDGTASPATESASSSARARP